MRMPCLSTDTLPLASTLPASSLPPRPSCLRLQPSSLLVVTVHKPQQAYSMAAYKAAESPKAIFSPAWSQELEDKERRSSHHLVISLQMHCNLCELVDMDNGECLVILMVKTFVIDGSVLSPPMEDMKEKQPNVVAKIEDAKLIKLMVSQGEGWFSP